MVGIDKISSSFLGEGYECVEDMGVGWGVWSKAIIGVDRMKGKKGPTFIISKGLGKCRVGFSH